MIDVLARSDAHLAACVVDGSVHNPFKGSTADWKVHARLTSQLVTGCVNRNELVGLLIDGISTPPGCSLEEDVRTQTNRRFGATAVVSAACLDSRTNDLLQLADLVAGAIYHERRRIGGLGGKASSDKTKVALRLAAAFGRPDLADGRYNRINIQTYRGPSRTRRRLPLRVAAE